MTAVVTDQLVDDSTAQAAAREAYRAASIKPTGKQLGDQFGKSARWGRYQIEEAKKQELAEQSATTAKAPVVVPQEPAKDRPRIRRRPGGPRGKQRRPWRRPQTPILAAHDAAQEPPGPSEPALTLQTAPEPPRRPRRRDGLVMSWLAFTVGILVSISANMLHSRVDGTPAGPAELIGAAFWPVALFLALEVLTRVPWPPKFWWWGFARYVGIGLVAVVAFVLSYRHMAGLLTYWGEDWWNAHLGPLAVDGLMLISATALLAISRARGQESQRLMEAQCAPQHCPHATS